MAPFAQQSAERPWVLRILLACGVLGPLLFVVVFLVEGATRPGYSAWRHFVSSLSLGPQGWVQIANFLVCGALVVAFAIGLRRALFPGAASTWGPILVGIFGLCLIGAGVFTTDPLLGYPPGAPSTPTWRGALHEFLSLIAFIALPAACLVLARRFAGDPAWRGWAAYSIATAILVVVFFIAADVAANAGPNAPAGLFQRLSIIIGWGWIALVALRLSGKDA
jgi:hypothetical membrane protein